MASEILVLASQTSRPLLTANEHVFPQTHTCKWWDLLQDFGQSEPTAPFYFQEAVWGLCAFPESEGLSG